MTRAAFAAHFAAIPHVARRAAEVRFTERGCWEWPVTSYPRIRLADGRLDYLHRISLEIALGQPLGNLCACHTCDNPKCANPSHLFAGTKGANSRDMAAKGRARGKITRGVANNKARLTDEEIGEVLHYLDSGAAVTETAVAFGVSRCAVYGWRDGRFRQEAREAYIEGSGSGNDGRPQPVRRWVA